MYIYNKKYCAFNAENMGERCEKILFVCLSFDLLITPLSNKPPSGVSEIQ